MRASSVATENLRVPARRDTALGNLLVTLVRGTPRLLSNGTTTEALATRNGRRVESSGATQTAARRTPNDPGTDVLLASVEWQLSLMRGVVTDGEPDRELAWEP